MSSSGQLDLDDNDKALFDRGPGIEESTAQVTELSTIEFIDPDIVEWDGPDDQWNPHNWPTRKRSWVSLIWILMTLTTSIQSSIFSSTNRAVAIEYGISENIAVCGTSLFILGYAFGPAAFGPVSERFGRKVPALTGVFVSSIFCIPIAVAYNIETIFVCRFLCGVFGAAPLATCSGGLTDMWESVDRGIALSTLLGAAFIGPAIGPIAGSFITASSLGWRWTMWVNAIFGFFVSIIALIWLPETFAPVVLSRKATKIRFETRRWAVRSRAQEEPTDMIRIFRIYMIRPWLLMATEPILVLMTLYSAFVYGILYLSFEAYPISFVSDRGWAPDISSLAFLAVGGGVILGSGLIIVDIKIRLAKRISIGHTELEPEERLPIMILGSFLLPIGLFWFAWTSDSSIPWPAQVIAGVVIATGLFIIYITCLLYIVDCYLAIANSAISANTSVRALFGAAFPLFAKTMYLRLGVAWATSTLAFVAMAMIPVPILFLKYGARLRTWSVIHRLKAERSVGGAGASGYGLATC